MFENISMERKLNRYAQQLCSNYEVLGWRYTVAKYFNFMWPERDEIENMSQTLGHPLGLNTSYIYS